MLVKCECWFSIEFQKLPNPQKFNPAKDSNKSGTLFQKKIPKKSQKNLENHKNPWNLWVQKMSKNLKLLQKCFDLLHFFRSHLPLFAVYPQGTWYLIKFLFMIENTQTKTLTNLEITWQRGYFCIVHLGFTKNSEFENPSWSRLGHTLLSLKNQRK